MTIRQHIDKINQRAYLQKSDKFLAETENVQFPHLDCGLPVDFKLLAYRLGFTLVEDEVPSVGGVAVGQGVVPFRNTKNYMALPFNPALKQRARDLRKASNLSEVLFWNQVKNKKFKNFDFDRQKIIGNYIVDFYCTNCNVVIEIDGSSHDNKVEYDAARDAYLESLGLVVIHISVVQVMRCMKDVMDMLFYHPALSGTPPQEGKVTQIDVFDYAYAELHSIVNSKNHLQFSKIDIPQVSYPKDEKTFWHFVASGKQLRQLHGLECLPSVFGTDKYKVQLHGDGDNVVRNSYLYPNGENYGKVFINDTQYFDRVPLVGWTFYMSGYQPAQKWLKDREGGKLKTEDILHYQKMILALSETIKMMDDITKIGMPREGFKVL